MGFIAIIIAGFIAGLIARGFLFGFIAGFLTVLIGSLFISLSSITAFSLLGNLTNSLTGFQITEFPLQQIFGLGNVIIGAIAGLVGGLINR